MMAKSQRAQTRLNTSAASIGTGLGAIAARVDAWRKQREAIAAELKAYVAHSHTLLAELGHTADLAVTRVIKEATHVDPPTGRPGRREGYRQSEEAKAKMRAAWAARKSRGASIGKGGFTKPSDMRASVRAIDGKRWTARQQGRG